MTSPVSRIDHLVVPVADPESLYALFTDGLGLPGLWPVTDVGPFRSAGVAAGNCWIEIVAGAEGLTPLYAPVLPAVFRGIAFDAPAGCGEAAKALRVANVAHGETQSFSGRRPDGSEGTLVTILPLDGLVSDAGIAYVCEMALPVSLERIAAKTERAAAAPGSPGIRAIADVQIGAQNPSELARRWAPISGGDGTVRTFAAGPSVTIKHSPIDGIAGVTMHVASVETAGTHLRDRGLLGPKRSSGVGVNHAAAHGLDIWLTTAPPSSA